MMTRYKKDRNEKIKLWMMANQKWRSHRDTAATVENPPVHMRIMAPICQQTPGPHVVCLISPLAPPICLIPVFSSPQFTTKWERHRRSCKTSQIQRMTHITQVTPLWILPNYCHWNTDRSFTRKHAHASNRQKCPSNTLCVTWLAKKY